MFQIRHTEYPHLAKILISIHFSPMENILFSPQPPTHGTNIQYCYGSVEKTRKLNYFRKINHARSTKFILIYTRNICGIVKKTQTINTTDSTPSASRLKEVNTYRRVECITESYSPSVPPDYIKPVIGLR